MFRTRNKLKCREFFAWTHDEVEPLTISVGNALHSLLVVEVGLIRANQEANTAPASPSSPKDKTQFLNIFILEAEACGEVWTFETSTLYCIISKEIPLDKTSDQTKAKPF